MKRPKSIAQRHLDAYRARAGEVGVLLSCVCCYPLERSDTTTAHDAKCPSHAMIVAKRNQPLADDDFLFLESPALPRSRSNFKTGMTLMHPGDKATWGAYGSKAKTKTKGKAKR